MIATCAACKQAIAWKDGKWRHVTSPLFQRHHARPLVKALA